MKGSFTSKSLGDLPEYRDDNSIVRGKKNFKDDDFADHWTDMGFGSGPTKTKGRDKDLFDEEPLPEPEFKSSSGRFSLFGSKKGAIKSPEGERLRPSRYDAVQERPISLEDELAESAAFSALPSTKKRERSTSFGGKLKTALSFGVFSKYEAVKKGGTDALVSDSDAPSQSDEETKFRGVHFSKHERGAKGSNEEHIVTATFSAKGVFIEEQPSGDYVDDISPSQVIKYVVDPKAGSFNLVVLRKSRYSATQSEYTVVLTSKHFDFMMACWKEIVRSDGGEPAASPRERDVILTETYPISGGSKRRPPKDEGDVYARSPPTYSPPSGRTPFDDDSSDGFSPRKMDSKNKSHHQQQPPQQHPTPRRDLLIDI